jgi:hypothetical protein
MPAMTEPMSVDVSMPTVKDPRGVGRGPYPEVVRGKIGLNGGEGDLRWGSSRLRLRKGDGEDECDVVDFG